MPIPLISQVFSQGISTIPYAITILKTVPFILLLVVLKRYFGGAQNGSERVMHSKVVMMTGGTSGIGAEVAKGLAARGAQLVLLTQHALSDPFLVEYIMDLRTQTNNDLITAEHCDLTSLHSIRLFATKWVDNAPPRRLDMIILCANTMTPRGGKISATTDGLESNWGLNYMANFHLLSILSPALRAQPADRDVRIIFGTCSSYMAGKLPEEGGPGAQIQETVKSGKSKTKTPQKPEAIRFTPGSAYATSKLALMTFASAFQKHLSTYSRPDKKPMNSRVIMVDPGFTRTPGMRRYITFGSLWGLAIYLVMWPLWWLVLKSSQQGAETFLYAAMEEQYGKGEGGKLLKECRQVAVARYEVKDEDVQKRLWEASDNTIQALEKEGALKRAKDKKGKEEVEKTSTGSTQTTGDAQASATDGSKKAGSRRSRKG